MNHPCWRARGVDAVLSVSPAWQEGRQLHGPRLVKNKISHLYCENTQNQPVLVCLLTVGCSYDNISQYFSLQIITFLLNKAQHRQFCLQILLSILQGKHEPGISYPTMSQSPNNSAHSEAWITEN